MSFIEHDKVSYPELIGHLKDHYPTYNEGQMLHWLFPGKQLVDGLQVLFDDSGCLTMSNYITDGGVADVFVEPVLQNFEVTDGSDYEDELLADKGEEEDESSDEDEDENVIPLCSPTRSVKGGPASVNLHAQVPSSQASSSVTINLTSGTASAKVSVSDPSKQMKTHKKKRALPLLLQSPK